MDVLRVGRLPAPLPECWTLDHYFAQPPLLAVDNYGHTRIGHLVCNAKHLKDRQSAVALEHHIAELGSCLPEWSLARRANVIASVPRSHRNHLLLNSMILGVKRVACGARQIELGWSTGPAPRMRTTPPAERPEQIFGRMTSPICRDEVVLLDDLVQTGSTLWEAARAIKAAGAREVVCLTAAQVRIPKAIRP